MNRYLKNLNRIEFVVTMACTGRCKHCSEGDHKNSGESIDKDIAADAVRKIAEEYNISSVMTFGGEPLLFPETVCAIHSTAREMNIPIKELITHPFPLDKLNEAMEVNVSQQGIKICYVAE